jgi:heparan-alpha-glucosaminide N-acetyltransferase
MRWSTGWSRCVLLLLLLAAAAVAVVAKEDESALAVRLVTALGSGVRASVEDLKTGKMVVEGKEVSFSEYATVGWSVTLRVTWLGTKSATIVLPAGGALGRTRATVFVATGSSAPALVWDLSEDSPVRSLGIDTARVRLLNGLDSAVGFRGVTVECHECLRPPLGDVVAANGAAEDYLALDGAHPWEVAAYFRNGSWNSAASAAGLPGWWQEALETVEVGGGAVRTRGELQDEGAIGGVTVTRFREHGVYSVLATPHGLVVHEDVEPDAIWIPLVVCLAVLALLALLVFRLQWDQCPGAKVPAPEEQQPPTPSPTPAPPRGAGEGSTKLPGRVTAIDIFRGVCLSIMVFVNYGGGGYWWLDHSRWDGLTVADLVFPAFVWTMGASMALSHAGMQKRLGAGGADWRVPATWQTLERGAKLIALGLFLNGGFDLSNWRMPGVLQYFGVSSVVVGLVDIWLPKLQPWGTTAGATAGATAAAAPAAPAASQLEESLLKADHAPLAEGGAAVAPAAAAPRAWGSPVAFLGDFLGRDLAPFALDWAFIAAVEVLYLTLQYAMPVQGCPTGYTGPGGLGDFGKYPNCTGGAHRAIDLALFGGPHHIYHWDDERGRAHSAATCADTYQCAVYDPEGALGALNACLMAFLGLQAGRMFLRARRDASSAWDLVARWAGSGLVLGAVGTALAGGRQWGGAIPINKNLWSPSFICVMAGISFCAVALLYVVADIRKLWAGKPYLWLGMNSIVIYAGSEILQPYFPFSFVLNTPNTGFANHALALASNVIGVLCWCVVGWRLYESGVFVKL